MSIIQFRGVRLRPMDEADQELVLQWRSDPEIGRVMYTQLRGATIETQRAWFRRISSSESHEYWIVENRGVPIGVANLAEISIMHLRADWAFYIGEKSHRGTGVGARVEFAVIYYVFFHRKLEKLSCQVLSNNEEIVKMHQKFGFVEEGLLRRHFHRDGAWLDLHLLALRSEEAVSRGYDKLPVIVTTT